MNKSVCSPPFHAFIKKQFIPKFGAVGSLRMANHICSNHIPLRVQVPPALPDIKKIIMSDLDEEYYNFFDFQNAVEAATAKLRRINEMQRVMRWQFGDAEFYQEFLNALQDAQEGWMSSAC